MNTTEIPYIIYAEETPNPASIKFVANRLLLPGGANADYKNVSETKDAPIAKSLFKFPFVKHVYVAANFVTITKQDNVLWEDCVQELRVFINDYLNKGGGVVDKLPEKEVYSDNTFSKKITINTQHNPSTGSGQTEIENKIIEILEQYIRPAVESDGGLITFKELKDGVVTVQMRGACSGCPSSTMTLKAGIEALLKKMLPNDVKEVVSEAL